MKLNLFDKICSVLAFVLGIIFLLLGGLGVFTGCKANFSLPPILGGLPLVFGWGIIKPILVSWKKPATPSQSLCYSGETA